METAPDALLCSTETSHRGAQIRSAREDVQTHLFEVPLNRMNVIEIRLVLRSDRLSCDSLAVFWNNFGIFAVFSFGRLHMLFPILLTLMI